MSSTIQQQKLYLIEKQRLMNIKIQRQLQRIEKKEKEQEIKDVKDVMPPILSPTHMLRDTDDRSETSGKHSQTHSRSSHSSHSSHSSQVSSDIDTNTDTDSDSDMTVPAPNIVTVTPPITSKPTPTPSTRKPPSRMLRDSDTDQVRKFTKDLHRTDPFNPKHEKEFDDQLEQLEHLAIVKGYSAHLLPQVITSIADKRVVRHITRSKIFTITDYMTFRDTLARTLFPFSDEIDVIKQQLNRDESWEDTEELIAWFEQTMSRYRTLRKRWGTTNAFRHDDQKSALLNKLFPAVRLVINNNNNCKKLSLGELKLEILRVANGLERMKQQSLRAPTVVPKKGTVQKIAMVSDSTHFVGLSSEPDRKQLFTPTRDSNPKFGAASPSERIEAEAPRVPRYPCKWCKSMTHFVRDCPEKPTCKTCGKPGHIETECYQTIHHGKLSRQTINMRNDGGTMRLLIKEDKSKIGELESLYKYHQTLFDRAVEARSRAAARKEDMNDACIAMVQVARGGLYAKFSLSETPIWLLLDSGADCNLLSWKTFLTLPLETRSTWKPTDSAIQMESLGGKFNLKGSVMLEMNSPFGVSREEFWIQEKPYEILGNEWLRRNKAIIDFENEVIRGENVSMDAIPFSRLGISEIPLDAVFATSAVELNSVSDLESRCDAKMDNKSKLEILDILLAHPKVWSTTTLGGAKNYEYNIETSTSTPVAMPCRHYSKEAKDEISRQTRLLISAGAVRKSTSSWLSHPLLVDKKSGEKRLCIDFRPLNAVTVSDPYPCPSATSVINDIGHSKYFITMDLKNGFHQIPIREQDRHKTAFWTPLGQMEWICVAFGLLNGTAAMARFLTLGLLGLQGVVVYVDDIVVHGDTMENLIIFFRQVIIRMDQIGACITIHKCSFGIKTLTFLGFEITAGTIKPPQATIDAIAALKTPQDPAALRRFLGLIGYFRHFIPEFSTIAGPMYELLQKAAVWEWTELRDSAYKKLKKELSSVPTLALPNPHWEYVLDTDASTTAIGATLSQRNESGVIFPVRFGSRRLTPAERNWPIYELEGFAIVYFMLNFRPYLIGRHFTVRTDHKPLQWLWDIEKPRLARWAMALQQFDFKIIYNPGKSNEHADVFTRDIDFTKSDEFVDTHLPSILALISAISVKDRIARIEEKATTQKDEVVYIQEKIQEYNITEDNITEDNNTTTTMTRFTDPDTPFPSIQDFIDSTTTTTQPESCIKQERLWVHRASGRVFVPEDLRGKIMFAFHYTRVGAHRGSQKMISSICRFFYWPRLHQDCVDYSNGCLTCQRRQVITRKYGEGTLLSTSFNVLVSIDMVGPYHHAGVKYTLLTMIDNLTKWVEVAILPDISAEAIWLAFYSMWIARLGVPFKVLSDNGSVFIAKSFQDRMKSLGIKTIQSTPNHPQGNSMIEAFHHYLNSALSRTSAVVKWSFQEILSSVMFAYRSTPHISTGESPYRLLTGCDMVLPHWQQWTEFEAMEKQGKNRFELIVHLRQEALNAAIQRSSADMRTKDLRVFEVGDIIIYQLTGNETDKLLKYFGNSKLMPSWSEPMRITKFLNDKKETFMTESVWHRGITRQVNKTQVQRFRPMPDKQFNEWYLTEAKNDKCMQRHGAKLDDLKTVEDPCGLTRDAMGRYIAIDKLKKSGHYQEEFAQDLIYHTSQDKAIQTEAVIQDLIPVNNLHSSNTPTNEEGITKAKGRKRARVCFAMLRKFEDLPGGAAC